MKYLAGPTLGIVDVYLDNIKVASVNQYRPDYLWNETWVSDLFPAGDHTLRFVYASDGSMANIDSIEVLTPIVLPTGVYDDLASSINYTGAWAAIVTTGGPYQDTWRYTNTFGDFAQLDFNGRQFKITYLAGPDLLGIMDIYVDGVKVVSL